MTAPGCDAKRLRCLPGADLSRILGNVATTIRRLGHVPLRQGTSFECTRCGASGTVQISTDIAPLAGTTGTVTGTIAKVRCDAEVVPHPEGGCQS